MYALIYTDPLSGEHDIWDYSKSYNKLYNEIQKTLKKYDFYNPMDLNIVELNETERGNGEKIPKVTNNSIVMKIPKKGE